MNPSLTVHVREERMTLLDHLICGEALDMEATFYSSQIKYFCKRKLENC